MKVINLPNRETFRTSNEEAGEFIEKIVIGEGDVTLSDYNNLDGEVRETVERFINWNHVYADNDYDTLCLKENLYNEWKGSGFQMSFEEFLEEFYTEL
jgi:hypothetical protein